MEKQVESEGSDRADNNMETEEIEGTDAVEEDRGKRPGCVVEPAVSDLEKEDEVRAAAGEADKNERPRLRITTSSVHADGVLSSEDDGCARHPGFGIEQGTLELVKIPRPEWSQPLNLPLPIPSPKAAPIIREFSRSWSALRLRASPSDAIPRKAEMGQEQSLLKNYEPRFTAGELTFPSEIALPSFLEPRVAIEDAHAFLVSIHLRFTLGTVSFL